LTISRLNSVPLIKPLLLVELPESVVDTVVPPDETKMLPPLTALVFEAVAPALMVSSPPLETVVEIAAPLVSVSKPLYVKVPDELPTRTDDTVVPPDAKMSPPPKTLVFEATVPALTVSWAPLDTVVEIAVPPENSPARTGETKPPELTPTKFADTAVPPETLRVPPETLRFDATPLE
jgi:hypothetical protein